MSSAAGFSLGLIRVFDGLFFFALIMVVVAIVSTSFSDKVRTRKVWLNLMIAWLAYSISYLLLVGRQTGPEPPFALCLFQAAMVYAVPALCVRFIPVSIGFFPYLCRCAIATASCVVDVCSRPQVFSLDNINIPQDCIARLRCFQKRHEPSSDTANYSESGQLYSVSTGPDDCRSY